MATRFLVNELSSSNGQLVVSSSIGMASTRTADVPIPGAFQTEHGTTWHGGTGFLYVSGTADHRAMLHYVGSAGTDPLNPIG